MRVDRVRGVTIETQANCAEFFPPLFIAYRQGLCRLVQFVFANLENVDVSHLLNTTVFDELLNDSHPSRVAFQE